jgi:hypothetical protein
MGSQRGSASVTGSQMGSAQEAFQKYYEDDSFKYNVEDLDFSTILGGDDGDDDVSDATE